MNQVSELTNTIANVRNQLSEKRAQLQSAISNVVSLTDTVDSFQTIINNLGHCMSQLPGGSGSPIDQFRALGCASSGSQSASSRLRPAS